MLIRVYEVDQRKPTGRVWEVTDKALPFLFPGNAQKQKEAVMKRACVIEKSDVRFFPFLR